MVLYLYGGTCSDSTNVKHTVYIYNYFMSYGKCGLGHCLRKNDADGITPQKNEVLLFIHSPHVTQ